MRTNFFFTNSHFTFNSNLTSILIIIHGFNVFGGFKYKNGLANCFKIYFGNTSSRITQDKILV